MEYLSGEREGAKVKKVIKIVAISLIGLMISAIIVWAAMFRPLTPVQIFFLAISGEDVTMADIDITREAIKREPASLVGNINGVELDLPLPNGATRYEAARSDAHVYMICTDTLEPYWENLPSLGYTLKDQMGSFYWYRNEERGTELHIFRRQYSHAFYIVEFYVQNLQQNIGEEQ